MCIFASGRGRQPDRMGRRSRVLIDLVGRANEVEVGVLVEVEVVEIGTGEECTYACEQICA